MRTGDVIHVHRGELERILSALEAASKILEIANQALTGPGAAVYGSPWASEIGMLREILDQQEVPA